jgi:hypothetical protein
MILRKLGVLAFLAFMTVNISLADDAWVLREDGIGPVKIGMGLPELNGVL